MTAWTPDEVDTIGAAEELQLAARRSDGTLREPVTIRVIRHGDDLCVRSWRGPTGSWFRAIRQTHEGRIRADGVDKDVRVVQTRDDLNHAIEAVYQRKYHRYSESYVEPMVRPNPRATSMKLVPRTRTDA